MGLSIDNRIKLYTKFTELYSTVVTLANSSIVGCYFGRYEMSYDMSISITLTVKLRYDSEDFIINLSYLDVDDDNVDGILSSFEKANDSLASLVVNKMDKYNEASNLCRTIDNLLKRIDNG